MPRSISSHSVAVRRALTTTALLVVAHCGHAAPPPSYPPLATPSHATKSEADVEISLQRYEYRFAEDGTFTETSHDTYRVLTQNGVDGWANTEARWSPWHMERPSIRATVKAPDGSVSRLEPSSLFEAAAYPDAPEIYADARVLRGPLPNVRVGSTVDEVVVRRSARPFPSGAEAFTTYFQVAQPRQRVELVIDVPERMAIAYAIRGAKVTVSDTRAGGRRVLAFSGGPYPGMEPLEGDLPSNVVEWPQVTFTTGTDWKQVASAYTGIVDDKLAGARLDAVVASVVGGGDSPAQKADKLLAWLHERVRYVGIELGASSIVPTTPDETLRRGYGDCKDQAVLLVALLRAAGLPAKVALLESGFGEDVDPSMPALNVFDHAIVFVPGQAPMWIDPTAVRARAGELPTGDQGRYALVADAATDALTKTPAPSERMNTYREARRITLPEYGGASVIETSTGTGAIERSIRGMGDRSPEDLAKWLKEYVASAYGSEKQGRIELSKADDLSTPFSMTVEATELTRSASDVLDATVDVDAGEVLSWVPRALREGEERKADFALQMPYEAELVYEIHPQPGFVLAQEPDVSDVTMGPAVLHRRLEKRDGGVLVFTYRFVLPNATWTARQVNDFRKGYDAFAARPKPALSLAHEGKKAHDARRYEDEVRLYQRDVASRPADAYAKVRLAQSLLHLGFGASARRLADEALKLAPSTVPIVTYAGYIRAHDLLGRWGKAGADLEGAAAAYKEALRIEPSSAFAATNLAIVLEYAPDGRRYAPGSKLEEAVTVLDHVEHLATYAGGKYVENLFFDLMWLGRYDDVRTRVRAMEPAKAPRTPAIVAATMLGGVDEGLAEAARLQIPDGARKAALTAAADALAQLRRYSEAAALLSVAGGGSGTPAERYRIELLSKSKPVDVEGLPVATPVDIGRKVMALCAARPPKWSEETHALYSKRARTKSLDEICDSVHKAAMQANPNAAAVVADGMLAVMQSHAEGSDTVGWRVTNQTGTNTFYVYVVREDGAYRLRAYDPADLGCEALALARGGHTEGAVQWLTWARPGVTPGTGNDPLRDEPFLTLWTDTASDAEVAAAALCASGHHADAAAPVLVPALAAASGARATTLALALAESYIGDGPYTDLLGLARRLTHDVPTSDRAWRLEVLALGELERFQESRDEAAAWVARAPNDPDALAMLALAEAALGRFDQAHAASERLLATHQATAEAYNEEAWRDLFMTVDGHDLDLALQAVQASPKEPRYLNTLAAIEVALGHTADGHDRLFEAIGLRPDKQPDAGDWYALGRLAERLALPDEARAAYAKVKGRTTADQDTVAHLAQIRLRALK